MMVLTEKCRQKVIFFFLCLFAIFLSACSSSFAARCAPDCAGMVLTEKSFAEEDFSNTDLSGANLRRTQFNEANLFNADLSGADLRWSDLTRANLSQARLIGTDLFGANLNEITLDNTDLTAANLSQTNFAGVRFSGVVTLTGALFEGAEMVAATLDDGNLRGSDMRQVNLTGGFLNGTDLTGALLTQADLSGVAAIDIKLTGANLTGASLVGANLTGANLTGASLVGANLTGANLTGADLSGADLTNANLGGAILTRAKLVGATLVETIFHGADLVEADLRWATWQSVVIVPNSLGGPGQTITSTIRLEGIRFNRRTHWPIDLQPPAVPARAAESAFTDLRVALLTNGSINDDGWNKVAYEALLALEEEGATILHRRVGQDVLGEINTLVERNFDIIIGHGASFSEDLLIAADQFPQISFIQIGGDATNGSNLVSYSFRRGEAGYVAGILAASMLPEGLVGYVQDVENNERQGHQSSFLQGMHVINPDTLSLSIARLGADGMTPQVAMITLISRDARIIVADGGSATLAAIEQVRSQPGLFVIGWTRDYSEVAPAILLTTIEQRIDNIVFEAVLGIRDGDIEWRHHTVGFAEGAYTLAPASPAVPPDVQAELDGVVSAIEQGLIWFDAAGNVIKDDYHY